MNENELTKYYEELLDFARRSCKGDEAEIIASDTILSTLEDIRAGKSIDNPSGYLRRVFARRKNDYLRSKYRESIVTYDDGSLLSLIPERREIDRSGEEYVRVRRELSRLNRLYREVTVRHYMRGEKIEDIATALGIPVGTVKRRLGSARDQVRDGLGMEEKYSQLSYAPRKVTIGIWGSTSRDQEPLKSVYSSLLLQNIMVAAYEKPLSVKAIGDMLGVPAAYIESELEKAVTNELMSKTSGGLYYTRTYMQKAEERFGDIPAQEKLADELIEPIWSMLKSKLESLSGLEKCRELSEKQRATLALHLLEKSIAIGKFIYPRCELPERPNGGRWLGICTYGDPCDFDVGKYDCSGPATSQKGSHFISDFQSAFGDTHWGFGRMKYSMTHNGLRDLLISLVDPDVKPDDERLLEDIPDLERMHILRRNESGVIVPDVPVIPRGEYDRLLGAIAEIQPQIDALLEPRVNELAENRHLEIPMHVDSREVFAKFGAAGALMLAMMYAAVERGFIDAKLGKTPIVVVNY